MKITLYAEPTETRNRKQHSLGTLSGITAEDLTEPGRQRILMDEIRSLFERSDLAPHTGYTGDTQLLPVLSPPSWWQRLIGRTR